MVDLFAEPPLDVFHRAGTKMYSASPHNFAQQNSYSTPRLGNTDEPSVLGVSQPSRAIRREVASVLESSNEPPPSSTSAPMRSPLIARDALSYNPSLVSASLEATASNPASDAHERLQYHLALNATPAPVRSHTPLASFQPALKHQSSGSVAIDCNSDSLNGNDRPFGSRTVHSVQSEIPKSRAQHTEQTARTMSGEVYQKALFDASSVERGSDRNEQHRASQPFHNLQTSLKESRRNSRSGADPSSPPHQAPRSLDATLSTPNRRIVSGMHPPDRSMTTTAHTTGTATSAAHVNPAITHESAGLTQNNTTLSLPEFMAGPKPLSLRDVWNLMTWTTLLQFCAILVACFVLLLWLQPGFISARREKDPPIVQRGASLWKALLWALFMAVTIGSVVVVFMVHKSNRWK